MESEEQKNHFLDARPARPFAAIFLHPRWATLDTQKQRVLQIAPSSGSKAKSRRFSARLRYLLLQPKAEVRLLGSDPPSLAG